MTKALSTQARKANQRNIEGTAKAVTQGENEKVQASKAPVIRIGLGNAISEQIQQVYGKAFTGLRQAIQALGKETPETREQAAKELRICQYKAQAKLNPDVEWKEGMVPKDFMARRGTAIFKAQRSVAANYSRSISIVNTLAKGINVKAICSSKSITEMAALADRSGSAPRVRKPLTTGQFENLLETLPYVCKDNTNEDQVKHLEKLLVQVMTLAEEHASALSDSVKRMLGIEMQPRKTKLRQVA